MVHSPRTFKSYCDNCGKDTLVEIITEVRSVPVRDELYEIEEHVPICTECREEVFVEDIEEANIQRAYDAYRLKHGLVFPYEIAEVRRMYGVSQRGLARILGWGEVTIHRYENGSLPDSAHNAILKSLKYPSRMLTFAEEAANRLDSDEASALIKRIKAILPTGHLPDEASIEEFGRAMGLAPDDEHGRRRFDFFRTAQMVLYLAGGTRCYLVKLMKLLWFCDVGAFQRFGRSLTGMAYAALPMGPVPDHYKWLMSILDRGWVSREPALDRVELIVPARQPDMSLFGEEETKVIDDVLERLGGLSTDELVELSHGDEAWWGTGIAERIPFSLTRGLPAD